MTYYWSKTCLLFHSAQCHTVTANNQDRITARTQTNSRSSYDSLQFTQLNGILVDVLVCIKARILVHTVHGWNRPSIDIKLKTVAVTTSPLHIVWRHIVMQAYHFQNTVKISLSPKFWKYHTILIMRYTWGIHALWIAFNVLLKLRSLDSLHL